MRVLGIGLKGAQKFCDLMDMPNFFHHSTYDMIVKHINQCIKSVAEILFKKTVKAEIAETYKEKNVDETTC